MGVATNGPWGVAHPDLRRMEPGNEPEELARSLPTAARRLLADHVHSTGELDLLLLLHADPRRAWHLEEICAALRCPPAWARKHLPAMIAAGVVAERDGSYVYAPASRQLDEALRALADAHENRWTALAQLVAAPRGRRRRTLADTPRPG
jgi:hypothetical protein